MFTLIRRLIEKKYKFQTNNYPEDLEQPIEFEDFYPRNNSRLEFIANQVVVDLVQSSTWVLLGSSIPTQQTKLKN